jgi:hypothetical protein
MYGTIDPEHIYDEYLVLLTKSGMTVGVSPFSHMRDACYRERVSFQLANVRFRCLVPPHLLEVMLSSF